jgi:hypothetical protein
MLSQKEIDYSLFGIYLGDGYVDKNRRNQMQISHCEKQLDYSKSIQMILRENHRGCTDIWFYGDGKHGFRASITARHYNYNRAWKANGNKYPSMYMLERLTPLGLAWLWCDDGSFRINRSSMGRQGRLSVCAFTEKENEKIMTLFSKNFDITGTRLIWQKGYPLISLNATGMQQLVDAVLPVMNLIPDCMRYKFDLQYEGRFEYSQNLSSRYNKSAFPEYTYSG